MRVIGRLLLFVIVVVNLLFVLLYVDDARLPARFVSMFQPEDGSYSSLQPRERIDAAATYALPTAAPGQGTINDAALDAMAAFAADQNSYSLVVVHAGVIQTEWYADGWDATRLAQSQSMHKSVLPVLIGAAIADGAIGSVDDRVGDYLPEWRDDPRGDITIKQLMTMSSGLKEYPFSLNPFSDAFQWLFASKTRPILLRTPRVAAPGTEFVYNNLNSEILGLVIEQATGQRYADYLDEKLWTPMGGGRVELWLEDEGGKAHTSCCLLSSAHDWTRFGLMLLGRGTVNGNRVIAAEYLDQIIAQSRNNPWYGYQIWLGYSAQMNPRARRLSGGYQRTDPFLAKDTFYASGFGAQRVYVVPSHELVIVRMGPATGREPVKPTWDNSFLVNTAIRGLQSTD